MSYILPIMILGLIIYALIKRVDIYSAFTEGAAEALPMLIRILPYMAGMLAAIQALHRDNILYHRALFRHGWHTPHARGIARGTYKLRYRYGGGDSPCARTICIMGQVML